MAHLGLSLAPIGQGTFRNAPRRVNNNSNNESVWEVETDLLTPLPIGNNYQPGGLEWARNRRQEFMTPKKNSTIRNIPKTPKKGTKPPSTPMRKAFRNLTAKAPGAPKKTKRNRRSRTRSRR